MENTNNNGYICFYNRKRIEVYAASLYDATMKARAAFNPPKSKLHMVSVMLAETNGTPVIHVATE